MVETWQVEGASPQQALSASAVALLLDAGEERQPARQILHFLNALVPVDYLSLVEYVPGQSRGIAAPELVEGHARPGVDNVTPDCFAPYRRHFWRADLGTRIAHHLPRASCSAVTALHVDAGDIPVESWRREIYERHQLAGRLSFFYTPVAGAAFAFNLYRNRSTGPFATGEIQCLLGVAPLLKKAHRGALHSPRHAAEITARVRTAEAGLRRQLPELSPRELAVCARIACGISADGIAADLDVAPSTVVTLRKRAYAKLAARGLGTGCLALARLAG